MLNITVGVTHGSVLLLFSILQNDIVNKQLFYITAIVDDRTSFTCILPNSINKITDTINNDHDMYIICFPKTESVLIANKVVKHKSLTDVRNYLPLRKH